MEVSERGFYRIFGFVPAEGRAQTREDFLETRSTRRIEFSGTSITERAIVEKTDYDHELRIPFTEWKGEVDPHCRPPRPFQGRRFGGVRRQFRPTSRSANLPSKSVKNCDN